MDKKYDSNYSIALDILSTLKEGGSSGKPGIGLNSEAHNEVDPKSVTGKGAFAQNKAGVKQDLKTIIGPLNVDQTDNSIVRFSPSPLPGIGSEDVNAIKVGYTLISQDNPDWSAKIIKVTEQDYHGLGSVCFTVDTKVVNVGGNYGWAHKQNDSATGDYSHAEGYLTIASGDYSHVEGGAAVSEEAVSYIGTGNITRIDTHVCTVPDKYSNIVETHISESITDPDTILAVAGTRGHATNIEKNIETHKYIVTVDFEIPQADPDYLYLHVFKKEKIINEAQGDYSHVEGSGNKATGYCSHVEGLNNIVSGYCSHVSGMYNFPDHNSIFIIGDGNKQDRSNILSINGNGIYMRGIGGYQGKETWSARSIQAVIENLEGGVNITNTPIKISNQINGCDVYEGVTIEWQKEYETTVSYIKAFKPDGKNVVITEVSGGWLDESGFWHQWTENNQIKIRKFKDVPNGPADSIKIINSNPSVQPIIKVQYYITK